VVPGEPEIYLPRVRIAIVSTPFVAVPPPLYGGTELVIDALGRALERAGHEVTVFATGDSHAPGLKATFETPVWPPDLYAEMLHCRFAAAEIARDAFDVVHAHSPGMLVFANGLPAPLVYTIHHAVDPVLTRFYERVAPEHLVAISARQAELARPAPQHVVHHGLEPDLYPRAGPGGDAAFFLGRLSWCKAPEVAIEAARLARLPIFVAGQVHSDAHPERWEEDVLGPALAQPHVQWTREADLAEKRRLFARSRALLVPLRWEEPFGLVIIEALLAGCPVVASPRGATPEIVEEGVTGFLVEGAEEMAAALGRAAALDRRGIQARARVRFSADRMATDYLAVYQGAVADHAGRAAALAGIAKGEAWTTFAQ
jgi:glycosyltransferase involved in cell wall biosynthesis